MDGGKMETSRGEKEEEWQRNGDNSISDQQRKDFLDKELMTGYSLRSKEALIQKFVKEFHGKVYTADGGKSKIKNTMVLCNVCHDRIHGKSPIELSPEDEIVENEE